MSSPSRSIDTQPARATPHAARPVGVDATLLSSVGALRSMLDSVGTNIFVADAAFNLVWMNRKAHETMHAMEDVTIDMFGLRTDELTGGSIDRFHKGTLRARVRQVLSNPQNLPYRKVLHVGPRRLDLTVNAIVEEQVVRGYVVNWEDVTEREAAQAESRRLRDMLDNITVNVMLADRDMVLVYMNPASRRTLQALQHLLPLPVDRMIGEKIDIFHKHPERQREMLRDGSRLPHRAQIQLGPESLMLHVVPIFDAQRNYLGPMLTWERITDRVKLSQEVQAVVAAVSSSATALEDGAGHHRTSSTQA